MIILHSLDDPQLRSLLRKGAVGVLPTDTVYGLCAPARQPEAVARLYELKQREQKPGTVIAANVQQLVELGLDESALRTVAHLWPNPLSIIIPASGTLNYLDQGVGSLAVRIPQDEALLQLLEKTGPLVTSSANHPGRPPAHNVAEAQVYFGDKVDFYLDAGDRINRPPSTVARIQNGRAEVLRAGAVTINEEGEIA